MNVTQIYELTNTIAKEALGEEAVQVEDMQGVIQSQRTILGVLGVENYVRKLTDHIGKVIFDNRPYTPNTLNLMREGWEFASIREKIRCDLPEAVENEMWQLEDGVSYDPNIFTAPSISADFWNDITSYEIDMSITDKQVKSALDNATQLSAFFAMIEQKVRDAFALRNEGLAKRVVNNMIGETVYAEYSDPSGTTPYGGKSGIRAVNLLKEYNDIYSTDATTAANALYKPEFIRYAAYRMGVYADNLESFSRLYNLKGLARHTPNSLLHIIIQSDFARASEVFLQSSTFHKDLVKLPNYTPISSWQGSGASASFADKSKIYITTNANHTVELPYVLGVMFDHEACGITNEDMRVDSLYNPKANFTNLWYKADAGYLNDPSENFVVFFMADAES